MRTKQEQAAFEGAVAAEVAAEGRLYDAVQRAQACESVLWALQREMSRDDVQVAYCSGLVAALRLLQDDLVVNLESWQFEARFTGR